MYKTIYRKTLLSSVIALLGATSFTTQADFTNGGFESPDTQNGLIAGWTLKTGLVKPGGLNSINTLGEGNINWCTENLVPIPMRVSECNNPGSLLTPNARIVKAPYIDAYLPQDPDFSGVKQGVQKAVLNWEQSGLKVVGNNHATQIAQTAVITKADIEQATKKLNLYVYWGRYWKIQVTLHRTNLFLKL